MTSAEVVIVAGVDRVRHALVPGQRLIAGRGEDAQLRLPGEGASRHHAALELGPGGLAVTDLGSKNGTRVDGAPLVAHRPALIATAGVIEIGSHRLEVRVAGAPPATSPGGAAPGVTPAGARSIKDDYERLSELGRGGMGRVFLAQERATGRRVAIKVLEALGGAAADPSALERFRREGRVRVDSPHVVQVLDARVENGVPCLVLELVTGQAVDDLLKAGPLPLPTALAICEQVALGLDAAHKAGLVHRDVKPGNVLVMADGTAKLSDFGIAKLASTNGASLTASGTGIGTLAYVAPEQAADAKRVTPAADLYALGATLFHLLAGRPPFPPGPDQIRALFEDDPPPLRSLRKDAPPEVASLVARLLEKEPEDRPPGAAAVARRLAELRQKLKG